MGAHVCPRIERSFVRDRHGIFNTVLMQQKAMEKKEEIHKHIALQDISSLKSPVKREHSADNKSITESSKSKRSGSKERTLTPQTPAEDPKSFFENLFKRRLTNHLVVQNHLAIKMKQGLYKKLIETYNQKVKQKSLEKRKINAFLKHQTAQQTKYFTKFKETELEQKERERQFYSFQNERFNNSDYALVRDMRSL